MPRKLKIEPERQERSNDNACEMCDWTPQDWSSRLMPFLQERYHDDDPLNVCQTCGESARRMVLRARDMRLKDEAQAAGAQLRLVK